ncbi:hypothetical protein AB4254_08280 [Vibrio breoganii]
MIKERYISDTGTHIRICLKKPDGWVLSRNIPYTNETRNNVYQHAIILRNTLGKELWQEFWPQVLTSDVLARLPRRLVPTLKIIKNNSGETHVYEMNWYQSTGNLKQRKSITRSISVRSKKEAIKECLEAFYEAHKPLEPIILHMKKHNHPRLREWKI